MTPSVAVTFHRVFTFGPSSPYVSPSPECVQVLPRSSLRHTAGPYQGLPPAGQQGARARLDGHVVDRPALAQRTPQVPGLSLRVAVEDEGALRGADEEDATLGHLISLPFLAWPDAAA